MKRILKIACLLLLSTGLLHGQELTGDEIMKRVERTLTAPSDQVLVEKLTLVEADGTQKSREIKLFQKGKEKRLIVFTSPKEIEGVSFLSISSERMYLYMPAFRKVRRIASAVKNENFMGTDFSYEDLSETEFSKKYSIKLLNSNSDNYILELVPEKDSDVSYSRLIMTVDRISYYYRKTEFYDKRGRLKKVMTADDIVKKDGYWIAKKIVMKNVISEHRTEMELISVKYDTGLSDDLFSIRNLKKMGRRR
ncbi:MAG: outer membrane lipoprotein-sorting protein [Fidelibacterota bacterium]